MNIWYVLGLVHWLQQSFLCRGTSTHGLHRFQPCCIWDHPKSEVVLDVGVQSFSTSMIFNVYMLICRYFQYILRVYKYIIVYIYILRVYIYIWCTSYVMCISIHNDAQRLSPNVQKSRTLMTRTDWSSLSQRAQRQMVSSHARGSSGMDLRGRGTKGSKSSTCHFLLSSWGHEHWINMNKLTSSSAESSPSPSSSSSTSDTWCPLLTSCRSCFLPWDLHLQIPLSSLQASAPVHLGTIPARNSERHADKPEKPENGRCLKPTKYSQAAVRKMMDRSDGTRIFSMALQ